MIVGHMVMRNEADRYLQASLTQLLKFCDEVVVVDDQSDDDSVEIARDLGCKVIVRPNEILSFLQDETYFRSYAWWAMTKELKLSNKDWIIALDADEYIYGGPDLISEVKNYDSISVPIREVWDVDPIQLRVDGFWDTNSHNRIVKYNPSFRFENSGSGTGSVPTGKYNTEIHDKHSPLMILHFGYTTPEDRQTKYERYTGMKNHGHNEKHIRSIIGTPTLIEAGTLVKFWRGKQ